ncbi:MAG: MFS transporter [Acidimicrobiales bacterium]
MSTASILKGADRGYKPNREVRRIVAAVSASSFIEWAGATAVLPLLPVYLRHEGSSVPLVGMTMAAFFVAAVLVQYPLGRLSDRIGRKKVQIAGLVVYAAGSVLFGLDASPLLALLFRFLQGAGGGIVQVANAATIGETVPESWQGRAFGGLYGAQTVGMAIGPFFGGLLGLSGMRWMFFGAAACSLAAVLPIKAFVPTGGYGRPPSTTQQKPPLWRNRSVVGVMIAFVAGGLLIGMYEVCWSLLLVLRGAQSWQIGLSWTLFALPFAVMALPAGWLVDRLDRRRLIVLALMVSAGFAALYPFLHSVALLVGLGAAEAVAVAIGQPAESAQLTQAVAPHELGRAQGAVSSAQTGATAVAAVLAGTLFGIDPAIPFVLVAAFMVAAAVVIAVLWRKVPGRRVITDGDVTGILGEEMAGLGLAGTTTGEITVGGNVAGSVEQDERAAGGWAG